MGDQRNIGEYGRSEEHRGTWGSEEYRGTWGSEEHREHGDQRNIGNMEIRGT